ncbi:glutaredoxin family protein [Rhodobacter sp. 24-YEA-8]|uniref:glutaredoxin family protein n=1 Tax=Rhodobacter sp. 24-YEA-8 TaxID=1884310 RepID=UPI0008957669|nr:glutaredoxin family protein [Rhodobacter sp. 24-YEA-8]SEB80565.1 ribonucleoside-diphosphate reductase class Ib glutaredoxin subunit [Rhodobacter sp. 24-YEA-8]
MIIIYTSPGCGPCVATKRALDRAGLAYEERAGADWPEEVERFRAEGHAQAPIVVLGSHIWSGFQPGMVGAILAKSSA